MLATTAEQVQALNTAAQAWRRAAGEVDGAATAPVAAGATAGAGDVVVSRKNDRRLTHGAGADFVKNGDRWVVASVGDDGTLAVVHERTKASVVLPAGYVSQFVELGYASTVHRAQGTTVDTAHAIVTGAETAEVAYVAMTRGRQENHVYVEQGVAGSEADQSRPEALRPQTGLEILGEVVQRRDPGARSAHTLAREDQVPAARLARTASRYADAVVVAIEDLVSEQRRQRIREVAEQRVRGITGEDGWTVVERRLALGVLAGKDPVRLTEAVVNPAALKGAKDRLALLAARAQRAVPTGSGRLDRPVGWAPDLPHVLAKNRTWGKYLKARHAAAAADTTQVRDQARQALASGEIPAWMRDIAGDEDLVLEVAVWRAAHQVPDTVTEPMGDPGVVLTGQSYQERLRERVDDARPEVMAGRRRWARALAHVPQLGEDPHAYRLYDQLAAAECAGVDVETIVKTQLDTAPLPTEAPAAALLWRVEDPLQRAAKTPPEGRARDTRERIEALKGRQQATAGRQGDASATSAAERVRRLKEQREAAPRRRPEQPPRREDPSRRGPSL